MQPSNRTSTWLDGLAAVVRQPSIQRSVFPCLPVLTDGMERPLTQTCFRAPWQPPLSPLRWVLAANIVLYSLGALAVRYFCCFSRRLGGSIFLLFLLASWRFDISVVSLGISAVRYSCISFAVPARKEASGLAVQLERILFLQVQLDQAASPPVDFYYLRPHA